MIELTRLQKSNHHETMINAPPKSAPMIVKVSERAIKLSTRKRTPAANLKQELPAMEEILRRSTNIK
jgi:hypothetical protein